MAKAKPGPMKPVVAKPAKEIGIPKSAPMAAKKMDEKIDKAKGIKEGSKKDIIEDRKILKKFKK
jgi:hypothetical protein